MAENPAPYHVPQQNRRNKLRVTTDQANLEQPSSHIFQTTLLPSLLQRNPPTSSSSSSSLQQFLNPSYIQNLRDHIIYQPFNGHQGLSLSLPCQHLPLDLHAQEQHDAVSVFGDSLKKNGEVRSSVPLGPFTGYASILMRSRFLKPAQQILDELCGTVLFDRSRSQVDSLDESPFVRDFVCFTDRIERSWKNSNLVSMLEEVYRKYKLYGQQMQSVIASFETVAGLGHAAPYISLAFKTISKHFCCLKNAIMDQVQVSDKTVSDNNIGKDTCERSSFHRQKLVQNLGCPRPPLWRSQRALPDHAVAVLKTWLYDNFLHPYPTDSEKQMLAQETGLSKSQVSNWFINARVRLWRPMIEEIHMLETGHTQRPAVFINHALNMPSGHINASSAEKLPKTTQIQQAAHAPTKRHKNKCAQIPKQKKEQNNVLLSNLSSDQQIGVGGSGDVSLVLALNQNNGNEFSRPFPLSVPHHFDLETKAEGDVGTGSEAQK